MKVQFENHEGEMDAASGSVVFYNQRFINICHAIPFLRKVDPSDSYQPWYYNGLKGIKGYSGVVYVCDKWFGTDDEAEYYIDNKYYGERRSKRSTIVFEGD